MAGGAGHIAASFAADAAVPARDGARSANFRVKPIAFTELCGTAAAVSDCAQGRQTPATLGLRLHAAATAREVADATTALWFAIDTSLQPILGAGGVAALYHCSLDQTASAHPCLTLDRPDALAGIDLPLLHATLARHPPAVVAAAAQAWFGAFHALLDSLVGSALTETMLRPVSGARSGHPPVADIDAWRNAHPEQMPGATIGATGIRMDAPMPGAEGLSSGRSSGASAGDT